MNAELVATLIEKDALISTLVTALKAAVDWETKLLAEENAGRARDYQFPEVPWIAPAREVLASAIVK